MSRLAVSFMLAALWPALAAGQDQAARDRLQRGRARLQVEADRARVGRAAIQSFRDINKRLRTATDTIVIGGGNLTVLATKEVAAVTRDAARQADSIMRQISSGLPLIRGTVVLVRRDTLRYRFRYETGPHAVIEFLPPNARVASMTESEIDAEEIAKQIEGTVAVRVMALTRSPVLFWRRGNLPLRQSDRDREPDWGLVRFDVLESPSLLGPRCYRGDIVACSMALGLTSVDDPVMAWYDSTTRIATVRTYQERATRYDSRDTEDCLRGDDAACGRALHAIDTYIRPPAGTQARDALFWQAIHMGGDGAIERLLTSRGTPAEALAAVAKVPADSVVRAWQQQIREGSLGSDDLTLVIALVAAGWVGLLLLLSTRISRWR